MRQKYDLPTEFKACLQSFVQIFKEQRDSICISVCKSNSNQNQATKLMLFQEVLPLGEVSANKLLRRTSYHALLDRIQ